MSFEQKEPLWTANFLLLMCTNVAFFTGFQMIVPTLPIYIQSLGGSQTMMGLLWGLFSLTSVGGRPFMGRWLDTSGRKITFLIGMLLSVMMILSYRWASSIPALLALGLIHGFGFCATSTAAATIAADLVPKSRLGEGMGYFSLAVTLAMGLGPFIGLSIVERFTFPMLFYVAAALTSLAFLIASWMGYHYSPSPELKPENRSLFEPKSMGPALVMFFNTTTFGTIFTFLAAYALQRGIENIGPFFIAYAVALGLARPLSGMIFDRRGPDIVVIPGLILVAASMFLLAKANSMSLFLAAAAIYGLGFGSVSPSMNALAVRGVPANRRGAAIGTFFIGFDSGVGVGAVLWGIVSQSIGYSSMYLAAMIPVGMSLLAYLGIVRSRQRS